MKLTRPVLAAASVAVIAAGSFTLLQEEPALEEATVRAVNGEVAGSVEPSTTPASTPATTTTEPTTTAAATTEDAAPTDTTSAEPTPTPGTAAEEPTTTVTEPTEPTTTVTEPTATTTAGTTTNTPLTTVKVPETTTTAPTTGPTTAPTATGAVGTESSTSRKPSTTAVTTLVVTTTVPAAPTQGPGGLDSKPSNPDNPLVAGTTSPAPAPDPKPNTNAAVVSPLKTAPKSTGGGDQRWFNRITGGSYGWPADAVQVYSPSMKREIPVAVLYATDSSGRRVSNAPTLYLLNGAGGSEQDTDWISQASNDLRKTYFGKGVNIVIPMEGAFSYYVDWAAQIPVKNIYYKGDQKWSTFLAGELPGAIEPYMNANGKRAIAGLSMSATSVLLLAEHNPNFYDAVGSFSGCAATSTPLPNAFVGLTVNRGAPGVMKPEHVFGPMGSDYNRYYDALVNVPKLRGTKTQLYISTGTGLAGETDMAGYLKTRLEDAGIGSAEAFIRGSSNAMTLQVEGGAIEGAMNACTHDLLVKLKANNVPVKHAELRNVGTHSWGSWRDDLKLSYDTVFKSALGL